jgi:hypothetical protein
MREPVPHVPQARHIPVVSNWHVGDGADGEIFVVLGKAACMVLSIDEALKLRAALDRHITYAQQPKPLIVEPGGVIDSLNVRAVMTGTLT